MNLYQARRICKFIKPGEFMEAIISAESMKSVVSLLNNIGVICEIVPTDKNNEDSINVRFIKEIGKRSIVIHWTDIIKIEKLGTTDLNCERILLKKGASIYFI